MKISRNVIYTVVSLVIAGAILSHLFSHFSLGEVLQLIKDADRRGVAMFLVLSFSMSFFRTWRYLLLLETSGYSPPRVTMFLVVLVRNLFSDLLPARIGTLSYVAIVTTRLGIPFHAAMSSWAYAFLFDIIALAPLVLVATLFVGGGTSLSPLALGIGGIVIAAITGALIASLPAALKIGEKLLDLTPLLPTTLRVKIRTLIEGCRVEVAKAREKGIFLQLLTLSMMVRLCKYGALYVFLFALLAPMGYTFGMLDPSKVFLGICAAELSASLPISGIAGFGLYQGAWAAVFELLGFPAYIAKITSLSHHIFTQAYGYGLGLAAMGILLLPYFKTETGEVAVRTRGTGSSRFYSRVGMAACAALVAVVALAQIPSVRAERRTFNPDDPTPREIAARTKIAQHLPGRIVFDSSRSGTFGIYSMNVDGSDLRTLVDTSGQEMYPDPSPDGNWIVYANARTTDRTSLADIWLMRRDGSDARLLAVNGTYPTFSADGSAVYFQRQRSLVVRHDLASGSENVVFPVGKESVRFQVVMPRISPDGKKVVFTSDKPDMWNAWIGDLETSKRTRIAQGCEPTWFSSGDRVAWILKQNVKERSGVAQYELATGEKEILHDLDAPRGHEYFPTIVHQDRFLLYSASSPGEHSHIDADYQIFVRDLTTGEHARITFDSFNNRWPKLLRDMVQK